jgi:hypothetical protein
MPERKYSVTEIDRMRKAIRHQFPLSYGGAVGEPLRLETKYDAHVEDRLRTYMMNGTDPDELDGGKPKSLRLRDLLIGDGD